VFQPFYAHPYNLFVYPMKREAQEQLGSDQRCLPVIPTNGRNPSGATMANVMAGQGARDSYGMTSQGHKLSVSRSYQLRPGRDPGYNSYPNYNLTSSIWEQFTTYTANKTRVPAPSYNCIGGFICPSKLISVVTSSV
jgi:hypothetical protein